jgi:hypothetical protein
VKNKKKIFFFKKMRGGEKINFKKTEERKKRGEYSFLN